MRYCILFSTGHITSSKNSLDPRHSRRLSNYPRHYWIELLQVGCKSTPFALDCPHALVNNIHFCTGFGDFEQHFSREIRLLEIQTAWICNWFHWSVALCRNSTPLLHPHQLDVHCMVQSGFRINCWY